MDEKGVYYVVDKRAGRDRRAARRQPADASTRTAGPAVTFRFNPTGGAAFGEYTAQNIGKPFAIVLDNQVISAPVIQAHIAGGSGIITGNFTPEEVVAARDPAPRRRAAGARSRCWSSARSGRSSGRTRSTPARLGGGRLRRGRRLHGVELRPRSAGIAIMALVVNVIADPRDDDADRRDADHARHRRHRADDRHGGRLERADLRAHPRGAEDGARAGTGDGSRLRAGDELDHRRQRHHADRRR